VAAGVTELRDDLGEGTGQCIDAIVQDVDKAQQYRQFKACTRQASREFVEVDHRLGTIGMGPHDDVPRRRYVEVVLAPLRHVVQLARLRGGPAWMRHRMFTRSKKASA